MALLKKLSLPLFFFLWSCLTIESWGLIASSNRDGIIIDEDYNDSFPNDTYIDRRAFPDNFKFGALTWAFKHEGAAFTDGKSVSIWDAFAQEDGIVLDNTTPNDGGDQYHRYHEDIQLMVDIGLDSYRFSIAWTRILPNGSRGDVNQAGIDYYNDLINSLIDAGIEPMVTLYEEDMPQSLEESYGGLLSRLFIDDFVYYANVCFSAFGDRVKHWVTFDEPNDFVPWGYAGRLVPPGRCSISTSYLSSNCTAGNSATEPYIAAHHVLLAHASAVELYRREYLGNQHGDIGMVIWFKWYEPLSNSTTDLEASERAMQFTAGWFIQPILSGEYPQVMKEMLGSRLPDFTSEESMRLRGSIDFIGLNTVSAIYCTYDDQYLPNTGYWQDMNISATAYKDNIPIGEYTGDYVVPWCIEKSLAYIQAHYDNFPTYITSLGAGYNASINDVDRIRFYSSYMRSLIIAIRNGSNVRGLYIWSLIDGFEAIYGISTQRFGIIYVDEEFNRYPRLSALWFKNMLVAYNSSESYM